MTPERSGCCDAVPPSTPPAFFFLAEDGIRGPLVTGVQTCALPICCGEATGGRSVHCGGLSVGGVDPARGVPDHVRTRPCRARHDVLGLCGGYPAGRGGGADLSRRSEERRVGKGRRGRWGGRAQCE